jgi:hypothetical protein
MKLQTKELRAVAAHDSLVCKNGKLNFLSPSSEAILVMAVEQNALGTCALKIGISRHADVTIASAHDPDSIALANHHFELAAFHAVGATGQLAHAILVWRLPRLVDDYRRATPRLLNNPANLSMRRCDGLSGVLHIFEASVRRFLHYHSTEKYFLSRRRCGVLQLTHIRLEQSISGRIRRRSVDD